jgi:hypothetical protein
MQDTSSPVADSTTARHPLAARPDSRRLWLGAVVICGVLSVALVGLAGRMEWRTQRALSSTNTAIQKRWGARLRQQQPTALIRRDARTGEVLAQARRVTLDSAAIDLVLTMDYRRLGLTYQTTYEANFTGRYKLHSLTEGAGRIDFTLPLPGEGGHLRDLSLTVNGKEPADVHYDLQQVTWSSAFRAGQAQTVEVRYIARGVGHYIYAVGEERVKQLDVTMQIVGVDLEHIDYPASCMSPTTATATSDGVRLEWHLANLLTSYDVGVDLPERPSPSRQIVRLALFAPVLLALFLASVLGGCWLTSKRLSLLHLALLGAAFAAFYLLLSYLVAWLELFAAIGIAAGVVALLVVNFLRMLLGWRFALWFGALPLVVFQAGASVALLSRQHTGLGAVCGLLLVLAVLMQFAARGRPGSAGSDPSASLTKI